MSHFPGYEPHTSAAHPTASRYTRHDQDDFPYSSEVATHHTGGGLPATPQLDNLMAEIQETLQHSQLTRTPSPQHAPAPYQPPPLPNGAQQLPASYWSPPSTAAPPVAAWDGPPASPPAYPTYASPPPQQHLGSPSLPTRISSRPDQQQQQYLPPSPSGRYSVGSNNSRFSGDSSMSQTQTQTASRPLPSLPVPRGSPASSTGAPTNRTPVGYPQRHQTFGGYYDPSHARRPSTGNSAPAPQPLYRPPISNSVSSPPIPQGSTAFAGGPQYATVADGSLRPVPALNGPTSRPHLEASSGPRRALSDVGYQNRSNLHASDSLLARAALNMRPNDPDLKYLQPWLLSHVATYFRDKVGKGLNIKGSIEYPMSFTGKEAVATIQSTFPPILQGNRRLAVEIARTLHRNIFFHEVDWAEGTLRDTVEEVYMFTEDEVSLASAGPSSSAMGLGGGVGEGTGIAPLPTGVVTMLTQCYSPYCTRETKEGRAIGECYSRFCPNRVRPMLERAGSSMSTATVEPPAPTSTTWDTVVPKELLQQLDKKEIARQCIIYEIISGEQEYVEDLDLYITHFINPIKNADPPIIAPHRLDHFVNTAFSEVPALLEHNRALLETMRIRQREQHPIVLAIGDLILQAALEWGSLYVKVMSDTVWGEVEVNEERLHNTTLETLFKDLPRKTPRRSDFRHFLTRAGTRLQRYPLLLENLLKKMPGGAEGEEDHPDRESCQAALDIIRSQCKEADLATAVQQNRLKLRDLANELITRTDTPELHLQEEGRQICMSGKMTRRPEGGAGLAEWTDLTVWLLDHYFIMTKTKRLDDGSTRSSVSRRPIPLELLRVSGWTDAPERKARGMRAVAGLVERGGSDPHTNIPGVADDRMVFPITIQGLGRYGGAVTLCVESDRMRQKWKSAFEEAIGMRAAVLDAQRVFDLSAMSDQTFGAAGSALSGGIDQASNLNGPPTCSVPFTASDGRSLVAIGCTSGLWIGLRHDPRSLRQVLHLKGITQCSVLQEFGFILVLAEKVLIAYPLESLVPTRTADPGHKQGPSRLSGNKDVLFFKCGKVGPRTLVIYVKKGGVNQTVFKALEPVGNIDRPRGGGGRGLFGFGGQRSEDFRGYKEFFIPADAYAIQYLRNTLSIHCARGFEIMNLDTLKTASIPDFSQLRGDPRAYHLQRRCEESRPLGMFRIGDNIFLLCYTDFAFFADKHGDPLPHRYNDIIEWEGTPASVAYSRPYIVAFSSNLIEVWDTNVSRRCQVIVGSNILCTYDAGGLGEEGTVNVTAGYPAHQHDDGSRRMHVMMRGQDRRYRVFEMCPISQANGYAYG